LQTSELLNFNPKQTGYGYSLIAQVWYSPFVIYVTILPSKFNISVLTATGLDLSTVLPSPICPYLFIF